MIASSAISNQTAPATAASDTPATHRSPSSLFRRESLDRIESPEKLDDYIRVSNPAVWMLLAVIVLLLAAAIVWATCVRLTDSIPTVVVAGDGIAVCYIPESQIGEIALGDGVALTASVSADGGAPIQGTVASISQQPLAPEQIALELADPYAMHRVNPVEWCYAVQIDLGGAQANGIYDAHVTTATYSAFDLVFGGAAR